MSSLNFTITATQAEFNNFADRLGYMSTVLNGQGVEVSNPETRTQFLQRIMKEKVANEFYTPFINDIQQQVADTREAEKEAMRDTVRDRVGVIFTP